MNLNQTFRNFFVKLQSLFPYRLRSFRNSVPYWLSLFITIFSVLKEGWHKDYPVNFKERKSDIPIPNFHGCSHFYIAREGTAGNLGDLET